MRLLRWAAQTIPQIIGPFIPIEPAFIQGLKVDFILESSPDLPAWYVSHFCLHILTIFMHILHRLSEEELSGTHYFMGSKTRRRHGVEGD